MGTDQAPPDQAPPEEAPLTVHCEGDIACVQFRDRHIDIPSVPAIQAQLQELVDGAREPKILLDFKNVWYMPTTALGMLVAFQVRLRKKNGRLHLTNLDAKIREVFEISTLDKFFEIYTDPTAAMQALGAGIEPGP